MIHDIILSMQKTAHSKNTKSRDIILKLENNKGIRGAIQGPKTKEDRLAEFSKGRATYLASIPGRSLYKQR